MARVPHCGLRGKRAASGSRTTARAATAANTLQLTKNRVAEVGIKIGSVLLPHINSLLEKLNPLIDRFSEFISENEVLQSEIKKLINQGKIYTKRLTTRGRTMEVDRKDPKGHYEINNLIMSCYWCNNAKTDEFSYEEFRKMSCRTNDIWGKRLNSKPNIAQLMDKDKLRCDWDTSKGIVLALPWGINTDSQKKTLTDNSDWNIVKNIIEKLLEQISTDNDKKILEKDFKIYLLNFRT